ncbi:hybrid sensor histidine kinase/response regulator transcription factor [Pseudoalteromonas sp. McH1-42]|uniref:hybrid sensor histidine kinase/response regulator transcription factor n=1 Tax=Pseudoalteromonas sp. McH1-42 TaxID=2917752 RepID=UPI001EF68375|nr:hybrid sensor histidine kinase/response regulator transcription factor [Pseudoalteromonas sp. McH1-42]MCG7560193.1 response regulator [Pseudoalteromonas sp. McH1-42]
MLKWSLVIILFVIIQCHVQAREVSQLRLHLQSIDKLDMVTIINSVSQDSQGYLWISGTSGVLRFDGYQSIFYPHPLARKVVEDAQGRRWLLTGHGLYLHNDQQDSFMPYMDTLRQQVPKGTRLFKDSFLSVRTMDNDAFRPAALYQDSQDKFWLVGDDGQLVHFSADEDAYQLYDLHSSGVKHNLRFSVTLYKGAPLFISKLGEVFWFERSSGTFIKLWQNRGLADTRIVTTGPDNALYAVSEQGFFRLEQPDSSQPSLIHFSDIDHHAITSVRSGRHAVYLGTGSELIVLDSNDRVSRVSKYHSDAQIQQIFLISNVFDDQGTVWLATNRAIFEVELKHSSDSANEISAVTQQPNIDGLQFDEGDNLWFVSLNRVYVKYKGHAESKPVYLDPAQPELDVHTVYAGRDGTLWFGASSALYRLEKGASLATRVSVPPVNAGNDFEIRDIEQSENGHLWLMTFQGIVEYDPYTERRVSFLPGHFKNLKKGSNDEVLACGFEIYILGQGVPTKVELQIPKSNKKLAVYDADIDPKGRLWAATSYGLLLHDLQAKRTQQLDLNGVYPNVLFAFIYRDRAEHMWLADMANLYKVSSDTLQVLYSTPFKRLSIGAKTYDSASESEAGTLYLGGINGIAALSNTQALAPYGVHISRVNVQGEPYAVYQDEQYSENTILPGRWFNSTQRNFKFEFVNIKRDRNVDVYYQYRLLGFDKDWTEAEQTQRSATYTNLPPGIYNFVIRSRAISSDWTESRFEFEIATPWYLTGWAFTLYAFGFVMLIGLLLFARTYQLRRRNLHLEELVLSRTKEIDQKRAQITSLMESKNVFFGNVSHELRTPLAVIMLPIKSMLKQENNDGNSKWHAAYSQALRLEKLIDNLIRYAKKDDVSPFENHHFTAKEVLLKQAHAFELLANEKQIHYKVTHTLDAQEVLLNEADFEQIITNLLSNAVKYTPEEGEIFIEAHQRGGFLKLVFTNSGPGICKSLQADVFKRYVRGEHSEISGQGIGLSVVHQLISDCGGDIVLSSEPGQGCQFTLMLPLYSEAIANDPDCGVQTETEFQVTDKAESNAHVLIVEDNPQLRMMLKESLSEWFDCTVACDGEQGLLQAKSELPDLIISDVMMPKKSGLEMLQEIKQDETTSHIPVILLTAKEDDDSRILGFEAEADDYIGKPCDLDVLRHRVENLIKGRKKLARLFADQILGSKPRVGALRDTKRLPFIDKIQQVIAQNYQDPKFDTESMASHVFLSVRQLQRKTRNLTGLSPNALLRQYRLEQARTQLQAGTLVAEVAYQVGFSSPAYFSSCFKAEFNMSPQHYTKQYEKESERRE